jgi:acetyltransferase-like isoleucine patch superfamily enzyme
MKSIKKYIRTILNVTLNLLSSFIPSMKIILETKKSQTPVRFKMLFIQKIIGFNKSAYWPVHHSSIVSNVKNIIIGVDTSPGFMGGCYIQGRGGIKIGDYTQISCNVGIISENHSVYDCRAHIKNKKEISVTIGKYCWIGMNSVILPNIELGDFTIVGAGSVVTKSFSEGFCVIAGNPAKVIKKLDKKDCVFYENDIEYCGFIKKASFEKFRVKELDI